MSDLFENIELQMQEDKKEKNPRSAILASQMETEKRFGKFIDENSNRVSIIEKEIKDVTDKYAYQYDVDPQMVYTATVSYLTKNAEYDLNEEEESGAVGILPGIRESLDLMRENGFSELAQKWEDRVASMSVEEQVNISPEVVDSFVEAVESSPQTEMWEMDPNQYDEWDKISSAHKDLSDEELLNKIKEEVQKMKKIDEPMSDALEELHQELWDRSGHGEKWRNRKSKESKTASEFGDLGHYAAYQIRGNDHFLCPHCAQEIAGDDFNWEDNLTGISASEMQDIMKYAGHSGKCDQCGMDLMEETQKESSHDQELWDLGNEIGRMAEQSGYSKMLERWERGGISPEAVANAARQLWEALKGDRRPEQREFYNAHKDELVDLMTRANQKLNLDESRISRRQSAVMRFVGVEEAFIQKQAMELHSGWITENLISLPNKNRPLKEWIEKNREWAVPKTTDGVVDRYKRLINSPGYGTETFGGGVNYELPGTPGLGPDKAVIPGATWHDYLMRSNLYGQKAIKPQKKQELNPEEGLPNVTGSSLFEQKLVEVYMNKGLSEKYASIIVESVGEMAQLQVDAPGVPVAANDPDNVNIDKEIGGKEGDKYRNINVEETAKALGIEHQDPGPEYEDVREFVQPGGEAPYADNDERTEKNKDKYKGEADRSKMDGKGVKQEDNAPSK